MEKRTDSQQDIVLEQYYPSCEWQFTWTEEEFREIHGILHFSALFLYLQDLAKTVFFCLRHIF